MGMRMQRWALPAGALLRWAALVLVAVLWIFPVYWVVTMAFKPRGEWGSTTGVFWWPHEWTLDNFRVVLGRPPTSSFVDVTTSQSAWPSIVNSLIAAGGGTLLALAVGVPAAYGISRYRAGGRRLPFMILQVRMLPPIVLLVPVFFMVVYLGLFDTRLGLILVYGGLTAPFVVWLMRGFFLSVPREVSEAAIVDGCTLWGAFFKIVLPQAKGCLAAVALFVLILNWSDLLIALVLTQDNATTAPVFLQKFSTKAGSLYGPQAALATILVVPPLLFGILIRDYLVRGLSFGAIKN